MPNREVFNCVACGRFSHGWSRWESNGSESVYVVTTYCGQCGERTKAL